MLQFRLNSMLQFRLTLFPNSSTKLKCGYCFEKVLNLINILFCETVIGLLFAVCLQYFTFLHKTVLDFNTQTKLIVVNQRCSRRVCYFTFYLHYK